MEDPNPNEPELDLYTIPINSSWFCWDDIHETERLSLKEFFDSSSISRTPKIYKEYRDFIINKYREDPSRRLTFTQVRKSLVGDVSLLHKVFLFLEKWGLINFLQGDDGGDATQEPEAGKVIVEQGPPSGVRVVAMPNLIKPISMPSQNFDGIGDNGIKLPPLASYSDVFGDLGKQLQCGNCGEGCDLGCYEYTKGNFILCSKCFKDGNYGEKRSVDDFMFKGSSGSNNSSAGSVWTEAETLLLLESVLKHGDNWDLVAQSVQTKTRLDCILKLIELPFGDFLMRSAHGGGNSMGISLDVNSLKTDNLPSTENQETVRTEDQRNEPTNQSAEHGSDEPPSKRQCITPLSDDSSILMKQVARISTMVGPDIAAAAAEAAVNALCDESSCPREIFDTDDDDVLPNGRQSAPQPHESERNGIPLTLRMRAAIGTAFGSAAAHARLLAAKEEREIELLVATIIDAQMKKLDCKMKHIDDLELMMEKDSLEIDKVKERLVAERIDVLQKAFSAGISKSKDHTIVKSETSGFN
ncbi:SWI/SNF complex subunit SWI3A [Rutidosis leptorrhynchoides]|uniref:SWI/SNF complex subunit SWI3A n=1 Tax=Rutidosis leptorrhynchoides TaxID=125765 RepID=UPI003A996A40